MKRTTVMLPPDLKHRAEYLAREEGISLAELVREALEARLAQGLQRDPFFSDHNVFGGTDIPEDLAENHDKYLYDDLH